MSDIHIDDFYRDVARIFLRLYLTFPRKTILYVEDICGEDNPDDFGLHSDRFLSGFGTMIWLGEHDYLRYDDTLKQEAIDQAVLSEKGFILLSSRSTLEMGEESHDDDIPPSIMEHSRSNIAQLRNAVKSGSSIMIRQCVHYQLSNGI